MKSVRSSVGSVRFSLIPESDQSFSRKMSEDFHLKTKQYRVAALRGFDAGKMSNSGTGKRKRRKGYLDYRTSVTSLPRRKKALR